MSEEVKTGKDRVIEAAVRVHSGCAPESCGGTQYDPCVLANALNAYFGIEGGPAHLYPAGTVGAEEQQRERECPEDAAEWIASTFLHIEQGDHLRIGQDEATVLMVSKLNWHATHDNPYQPKAWEHVQVEADLGFGRSPFPSDTVVEILCDAERKAQLIMSHAGLKPRRVDSDA